MPEKPKTPQGLKAQGAEFWDKVLSEFVLEKAHDLERLSLASKCLDELAADEATVAADGRFFTNTKTGQIREHPAAKAIRENKVLFARLVRELGLDLESAQESRLPGRY
jgi:phage terminase small subunit